MKLQEWIKVLTHIVKENPELKNAELITSKDDEGNAFNKVHFHPHPGIFNEADESYQPLNSDPKKDTVVEIENCNCICLN
jgi:hypothetical protein